MSQAPSSSRTSDKQVCSDVIAEVRRLEELDPLDPEGGENALYDVAYQGGDVGMWARLGDLASTGSKDNLVEMVGGI